MQMKKHRFITLWVLHCFSRSKCHEITLPLGPFLSCPLSFLRWAVPGDDSSPWPCVHRDPRQLCVGGVLSPAWGVRRVVHLPQRRCHPWPALNPRKARRHFPLLHGPHSVSSGAQCARSQRACCFQSAESGEHDHQAISRNSFKHPESLQQYSLWGILQVREN